MICCITPASLKGWPEGSIAVVAHDAGSSRLLQSWLSSLGPELSFCVSGPAQALFEAERGALPKLELKECLQGCQLLISGTGWNNSIEHESRCMAAELKIPSIAVLDHWVNYLTRFERRGITKHPDCLWVADDEAAKLADHLFKNIPIKQLPNVWLEELKNEVETKRECLSRHKLIKPAKNLLYFLELIRDHRSGVLNGKEFLALNYWLMKLCES